MAIFDNPFSLEFTVHVGYLDIIVFINENLYVTSNECNSVPHNHHDYELRYISKGSAKQIIENSTITASAGDLIFIHPMEFHCQHHTADQGFSAQYNLRFSIPEPSPEQTSQVNAYQKVRGLLDSTRVLHDTDGTMLFYLNQLREEIYWKQPGYVISIQSFCSLILTELFRLFKTVSKTLFPTDELQYSGYERTRIDELFRHKYLSDITIADFAKDMRLSRSQINRIMHKMFGMSFSQKLVEMRLQHAAFLLQVTDKTSTQISLECGFKSYSNFYTRFMEKFHLSPTEFRKAFPVQ